MSITILGKRYKIRFVHAKELKNKYADCDSPETPHKEIRIWCGLKRYPNKLLEIIIHEIMHVSDWSKDEEWVRQFAIDMARTIAKLGFEFQDGKINI